MADPLALLRDAKKAAAGSTSPWNFFSKNEKLEEAADLYTRAANAFRMKKLNKEAGEAFEEAAKIQTNQLNEPDDAANSLLEASKVYRENYPADAARCLTQSINRYTSNGNFRRAATHMEVLGGCYEDMNEQGKALESYETAASWFESDNAKALANKLYLKVADISASSGDYYKAVELLERVAASSIKSDIMRYSIKEYFYKAGMYHLAIGDMVAVKRAFEKYNDMDPTFPSTREGQHLNKLLELVEAGDPEKFAKYLFEYDQLYTLKGWETNVLLKIKNAMDEAGEDFS